jgi:hypothetical protein
MRVRVVASRASRSDHTAGIVSCTKSNCFRPRTLLLTAALNLMALLLLAGTSAAQCALNPTSPSVTICSPANGAAVTSPVSVVAGTTDTAHPVTAMKVYLDSARKRVHCLRPACDRRTWRGGREQFPYRCIQEYPRECHGDRSAERHWPEQPCCVPDVAFEKQEAIQARSGATFCFR